MQHSEADGSGAAGDTERAPDADPGSAAGESTDSGREADRDPMMMLLVRWEEAVARGEDPGPADAVRR